MTTNSFRTRRALAWAAVAGALALVVPAPSAQQTLHLNPIIEKLAAGQTAIGVSTGDLSMENARTIARADVDFVRLDMEHTPMDFTALRDFLVGMIDRQLAVKKGNAQPKVAAVARFLPYGRDNVQWVSKQALDLGLMGIAFNTIDNPEQALSAVRSMRYPPARDAQYREPAGVRGIGSEWATWIWGVDDYRERADLWPLNPRGDLLAIMMIESAEALSKIDGIASTPGVGVVWAAAANDLAASMGVPLNSPEVEAARQKILKACLTHKVVCGINPSSPADAAKRAKEGWRYIEVGRVGGVTPAGAAMIDAVRKAK